MACFIAPVTEAVIVSVVEKNIEKKENAHACEHENTCDNVKIPTTRKIKWLKNMLWGGSGLLAFEHLWHGEVIATFPFLSAVSSTAGTIEMLKEIATVGVSMAALVTLIWFGMCKAADSIAAKGISEETAEE